MASKTTYFVQAFAPNRGMLKAGKREEAPTVNGAIKKADAWSTREKGVAALQVVADDETGEVASATILASHGVVPDDLVEQIKGG